MFPVYLAQVLLEQDAEAVEDTALVFSGPQFFSALIAGIVLAFAFQLLLTNLGVATGISLAGGGDSSSSDYQDHSSFGRTIKKISVGLGIATLISVTLSLFFATLFAVKLSLFVSPFSGAIVGLVIWAAFFTLVAWLSSNAVGSLLGSVVNTATSGVQAIWGTAMAAFGAKSASDQVVATAESAVAAVKREIGAAIDPDTIRERVEDYLQAVRPPELDLNQIAADFEALLDDENLQEIVNSDNIRDVDKSTFVNLVSSRTDLSKRDVERIANKLNSVWNKTVRRVRLAPAKESVRDYVGELSTYIGSATREQLLGSDFSSKLDELIDELRKRRRQSQSSGGLKSQAMTMGFNSLNSITAMLMGRTDLNDIDVDQIVSKLGELREYFGQQTDKVAAQVGLKEKPSYSAVYHDVENFILNAYPWQLKDAQLEYEFRNVLYDPDADPASVAEELEKFNRSDFAALLEQKGVYTQDQIRHIATQLDGIRLEVLATAEAAVEREKQIQLLADVERYLLNTTPEGLTPEQIELNFKPIIEDTDATNLEEYRVRLAQLDTPMFERILEQRGDLDPMQISTIANELSMTRDRVLQTAEEEFGAAKVKAEAKWKQLQSKLSTSSKSNLNAEAIRHELQLLLDEPQATRAAIRARIEQFDRDSLVQLLSQRTDMSQAEADHLINQIESTWTRVTYGPKKLAGQAQEKYEQATGAIAEYLRNTDRSELDPEGIRRDLGLLLNDPQAGYSAIRRRLGEVDRDTLVQLLAQRRDLSEEEANRIVGDVLHTLRDIARTPRRLALRSQAKVQDFQSAIADYLRNTERAELSPKGIERDLKLLLDDPRAGMISLQQRLAHFDRDTLVALLSQREDLSEEDVNRIIDQILSVRDQILAPFLAVQTRIQSAIDILFERIRSYLNSLERPELNYEGIRHDMNTLFHDPQAGFDALRDRLSQVNRDTLVAVMSSRPDMSEADANRIIDQVESTRDRVLQRAERLQQQTQMRLEQVKLEAQRRADETRKAAAAASWWLFATALVSALAAAAGGAIAVVD